MKRKAQVIYLEDSLIYRKLMLSMWDECIKCSWTWRDQLSTLWTMKKTTCSVKKYHRRWISNEIMIYYKLFSNNVPNRNLRYLALQELSHQSLLTSLWKAHMLWLLNIYIYSANLFAFNYIYRYFSFSACIFKKTINYSSFLVYRARRTAFTCYKLL